MKKSTLDTVCLGFDWIQLCAIGEMPLIDDCGTQLSDDIYLTRRAYGRGVFQNIADVVYFGQQVAEICYNPRAEFLHPLTCSVKLHNTVCYETGISQLIKDILKACRLEFNNWTRIDFCLDGYNLLKPLKKAALTSMTKLMDEHKAIAEIKLVGKSDITTYISNNGHVKGIYVGKRSSDKSLIGYDKTAELKLSRKQYIIDWWQRNGLNTENVERLEIRCKGSELKRYDLFNQDKQRDPVGVIDRLMKVPELFETFFYSISRKLYEFVDVNAKRTDTAERLYCIRERLVNASKKLLQKVTRLAASELGRMKQAAKTAYFQFLATGKKFYKLYAEDTARQVDHNKWFQEKLIDWRKEFRIRDGNNRFQFITRLHLYEINEQLNLVHKV